MAGAFPAHPEFGRGGRAGAAMGDHRTGEFVRAAGALVVALGCVVAASAAVSVFAPSTAGAAGPAPVAYVVNHGSDTVTPLDTATNTTGTPIHLGGTPPSSYGVAITPDGRTAYVSNEQDNDVKVIDTATNKVVATVPVGLAPFDIAITPNGATAYVANESDGTVTPIDTATNTAGTAITVAIAPEQLAVTPDGATVYVVDDASGAVTPISTATDTAGTPITVGSNPDAIAITPDGSTAYVANSFSNTVTPINIATNIAGTPIAVGSRPDAIAITPNGATAYVVNGLDATVTPIATATNTTGTPIGVSPSSEKIAITPDGSTAYVTSSFADTVTPIATATDTAGTPITVGTAPVGIAITPDQAPVARLSVTPAPATMPTSFDATASTAPGAPIASYFWHFGDGNTATTITATTTHTYALPGTYTATVTETDTDGTSTTQVFTGQTVTDNGGPGAVASNTFTIVSCTANSTCSASISTPDQSVSATGVSTTNTTLTLFDTVTTLDCGTKYDYPTTVSTLLESNFTSTSGLAVQVTQANETTTKGVKVCYQPAIPSPPPPALLKKCSGHVPAPCYVSISESSGSVMTSLKVPAGDPRFWVGSGALGLKSFSPTSGPTGTTMTVKGKALGAVTGVTFGGTQAVGTNLRISPSGSSLTVTVPPNALSGAVEIVGDGGVSPSKKPFKVT